MKLTWNDIEHRLSGLRPVGGGFSITQRGLLSLNDGRHVFIKIGLQDDTKHWVKKEIAVYRFLQHQGYPHIPELVAVNNDETGFAITSLATEDGWDWSGSWTHARLDATLAARDALAAITPTGADRAYFSRQTIGRHNEGWVPLLASPELQATLRAKLRAAGHDDLAARLNWAREAERSQAFEFRDDALSHNDLRADNCAWNARLAAVKLVDWDWMHLGDGRLDVAATLVHVQQSGLAVMTRHAGRLDANALHWLAGYWLRSAATPIWSGGQARLRDLQLQSGLTALELARQIEA
ncbi:MAG TPA: hypothetical protein VLI05_00920 [Candidatus Saccharimonadia bacterium]|nr:hypothetical protein [Candidatus Saccharimonadia bacterium]